MKNKIILVMIVFLLPIVNAFNFSENFENFNYTIISHPNPLVFNCNSAYLGIGHVEVTGEFMNYVVCRAEGLQEHTNITKVIGDCYDSSTCIGFKKRDLDDTNLTGYNVFHFSNLTNYTALSSDIISIDMKRGNNVAQGDQHADILFSFYDGDSDFTVSMLRDISSITATPNCSGGAGFVY